MTAMLPDLLLSFAWLGEPATAEAIALEQARPSVAYTSGAFPATIVGIEGSIYLDINPPTPLYRPLQK